MYWHINQVYDEDDEPTFQEENERSTDLGRWNETIQQKSLVLSVKDH